ncbi:hypothetical protein IWW57_004775, partial [Coemansia sp. S610]
RVAGATRKVGRAVCTIVRCKRAACKDTATVTTTTTTTTTTTAVTTTVVKMTTTKEPVAVPVKKLVVNVPDTEPAVAKELADDTVPVVTALADVKKSN